MRNPRRFADYYWLGGALMVGAIVRFAYISRVSISHDEGYTIWLSQMSVVEIVARTARDVHPPLYYLLMHGWMNLFGTSELAVRSLSVVFMLGVIVMGFLVTRRLFGSQSARLAALLLATAPFLVRYSQEARMYGMLAFLLTAATYLLLRLLEEPKRSLYIWYAVVIAAALYTHYYAVFGILLHWLYAAIWTPRQADNHVVHRGLRDKGWWLASAGALALFAPWLPTAYAQLKHSNGLWWVKHVGFETIPNTFSQYVAYDDISSVMPRWAVALLALGFCGFIAFLFARRRNDRKALSLLIVWMFAAPVVVWLASLKQPMYVDRYFVFASVGFYILLAALPFLVWPGNHNARLRMVCMCWLLLAFTSGNANVYTRPDEQTREVSVEVAQRFQPGDGLIAGELWVLLNFTYYNRTGQTLQLLAPQRVNGYAESGLFYDRKDDLVVSGFAELHPATGRVWVIGKPTKNEYFKAVPKNWLATERIQAGYTVAQLYVIR